MLASWRSATLVPAVLGVVLTVACGQAPAPAEPAAAPDPWLGVWSVASLTFPGNDPIDPAQPGLWIFTDGYYSAVWTRTAEPRVAAAIHFQPTDEEKVAEYDSIIVNTGTYSVNGTTMTFRPMVAKSPGFIGGTSTAEFTISGDTMTLNVTATTSSAGVEAPGPSPASYALRRLR